MQSRLTLSIDHVLYSVQEQFFFSVCNGVKLNIFLKVVGSIQFLSGPHPPYSKEIQTKSFLHTRKMSTTYNKQLDFLFYMNRIES